MSKKLRIGRPLYIAPEIRGWLDKNFNPVVKDERSGRNLNPNNASDKIIIYERQVKEWFLKPAARYIKGKNSGFIVLMICMSYLEGVEQYKSGLYSNNRSREFFVRAIEKIYPNKYSRSNLNELYKEARCGLFHTGMVKGKIIISDAFNEPLEFEDSSTINVNPKKLLGDIKKDFQKFINQLKTNSESRAKFNRMYSNI
ncbi:MAG: hypothetical protein D4R93_00750 [Deltaproteobacteria bacterium]|nr:MAG: hypothetical protein D4R93_00750 [Deltaproteobacteria bacterium]